MMPGRKSILLFVFSFVIVHLSFSQSDSVFWNREFQFGATVFMNRKDLAFYNRDGHFQPGYSVDYSLKRIHSSGHGVIFSFGINTFGWKSEKEDFYETLSPEQIELSRAVDYSVFHYTFSHVSFGYYYRRNCPQFIFEGDVSIGSQLISYTRFRDIRKYQSGGFKYLRDDELLELNPAPSIEINAKLARRIGKRHLLFFDLKYIGFLNTDPVNWFSFSAFNLGVSKDFMLKKRKPRNGKKFNDNYIFLEALGVADYYSLNYERNISTFENFRLNIRAGFGYYEFFDQIVGINLVLGNRIERFELALTYNNRKDTGYENTTHIISPSVSYRAETVKKWLFRLTLGPAVAIQPEAHEFSLIFGASVGKKFGKK